MKKWISLSLLLFIMNHVAFADDDTQFLPCGGKWYVSLGAGASYNHLRKNNYIFTGTAWPRDNFMTTRFNTSALINVGGGYIWPTFKKWLPFYSLGIEYSYVFPENVYGKIDQYSLPAYFNYTYRYHAKRQTLLAVFKTDIYQFQLYQLESLLPYITFGAGISFNKAFAYREYPTKNITQRVSPGFGTKTASYFSALVGFGIDVMLRDYSSLSFEYSYGTYGYVKTGKGDNTPTASGENYRGEFLKNRLTASVLQINFNYLFG